MQPGSDSDGETDVEADAETDSERKSETKSDVEFEDIAGLIKNALMYSMMSSIPHSTSSRFDKLVFTGNMKFRARDLHGALEDFTAADGLGQLDFHSVERLAELHGQVGTFALAASTWDRAARMNPSNARVRQQRGSCRFVLGDTAGAIQDFTDAIQIGLDNADSYSHRSSTYSYMGDMPAALADLDQAVAKEKWNPEALSRRAALHGQMGNYGKALADLDAADAIAPLDALDQQQRQLFADVASGKTDATEVGFLNVDLTHAKQMVRMQDYAGALPGLERALKSPR